MERETPHCGTRVQLLPQDPSLWENESWESYFVAAYSLTKAGERNRNTENLQHHSFNKLEGWLDAEHAPPSRYQNTVEGRPEFGSPPYHQHGVEHRKPHLHNPVPKTPNYLFNCKAWKSLSVSCVELRNKLPFELNANQQEYFPITRAIPNPASSSQKLTSVPCTEISFSAVLYAILLSTRQLANQPPLSPMGKNLSHPRPFVPNQVPNNQKHHALMHLKNLTMSRFTTQKPEF